MTDTAQLDISSPMSGSEYTAVRPDGTRLRTVTTGSIGDPTVVLVHGYGFTIDSWTLVAEMLTARDFRVVAFDQRGHGNSDIGSDGIGSEQMAGDLRAVAEELDVDDAVLVGHSMGSFVSIRFMIDHPEAAQSRFAGAVFAGPFAGDIHGGSLRNRVLIPLLRSGLVTTAMGRWPAVAEAVTRTFVGRPFDPAYVGPFTDMFAGQDHRALVPILDAFVDEDHYDRVDEIPIPCDLLRGTRDRTAAAVHAERLVTRIPAATLRLLEDRGHLLNWEAPGAIVERVTQMAPNRGRTDD